MCRDTEGGAEGEIPELVSAFISLRQASVRSTPLALNRQTVAIRPRTGSFGLVCRQNVGKVLAPLTHGLSERLRRIPLVTLEQMPIDVGCCGARPMPQALLDKD